MTGLRKLWVRIAAPVVLLGGIGAIAGVTRAREMKAYLRTFADSLEHGSGPLSLRVRFVPFYVDGERIGFVNTLHIARHEPGSVDSVLLEVDPRSDARVARAADCTLRLRTFDPGSFKRALSCESEPGNMIRFGSVRLGEGSPAVALYLRPREHACAPWQKDREACRAARRDAMSDVQAEVDQVRAEAERIRVQVREQVREQVQAEIPVAPRPPAR